MPMDAIPALEKCGYRLAACDPRQELLELFDASKSERADACLLQQTMTLAAWP
jgi:hypothetical protein